ncbi:Hypothetical predicted protein [Podarcis lilfordi]|uniref:CUB and zona pellucida like domains 1 n=1 Tax=Podarcis lilfordi TaxID=74358 RepID=A0AA35KC77_9SAUR|nr:Hypothetical predicted protein [Podarcis lilfordi]
MDQTVIFFWVLLSASGVKSATTVAKGSYSCGKTFTDPSRSFSPPYYNGGGDVVECLWTIVSYYKIPIVLTLDYFSLDCTREYIQIYDGMVDHSALLGQICDGPSQVFVSRSGLMKVLLHRGSYRAGSGFFAYYDITDLATSPVPELTTAPELTTEPVYTTTLPPETTTTTLPPETTTPFQCGGILSEPYGYIYGPDYPGYGRLVQCAWEIKAPMFYSRVVLQFKTVGWNLNCRTDYIAIYDGGLGSSRQLGRICLPTRHVFISTSDIMTVELYRNSFNAGPSFTAYYYTTPQETTTEHILQETTTEHILQETTTEHIDPTSVTPEATTEATTAAVLSTTGEPTTIVTQSSSTPPAPSTPIVCGGYLSLPNGSFSGPYYPGNGAIIQCSWEIQVSPDRQIVLQFSYISLDCNKEYIVIFDGYPYDSTILGRTCSGIYLNYTYISTSNTMTILLHRDSYYSGDGFYASYYSIPLRIETTTEPPLNESTAALPTSLAPVPARTLSCSGEYMLARISRDYLGLLGYNASEVSLNTSDPFCTPQITQDYVVFEIPYSGCGTVRKQSNNDTITYSNIIKTLAAGYIITRRKNFQFHIMCEMNAMTVVETMFVAQNSIDITERKLGNYSVALSFYESSSFNISVRSFPYFVYLNQVLYLQATLNSSDPNLVLFLDTCVASPYPGDFRTLTYDLIKNGCVRDPTFLNLSELGFNSSNNQVRFKFNSFKFLYEHNQIYLQCKLVVCKAYDYSSRCYQGCLTRRKRDTDEPQDKVDVVVGPVKLQKETIEDKGQELAKSMNLEKKEALSPLAVTTVLLAAMVFVLSGLLISSKLRRKNYLQIY